MIVKLQEIVRIQGLGLRMDKGLGLMARQPGTCKLFLELFAQLLRNQAGAGDGLVRMLGCSAIY